MHAPTPAIRSRRAAVAFIFVTLLIDVLSFGVIIPVLPTLVRDFTGGDFAAAARWVGWFGFLFAALQFVSSPLQGALSDRYGRRPVILASCLGLGVDFMVMALAQSLPVLLLARMVSGVFSASFTSANAYIADITPADKRAQAYGIIGAAFGVGLRGRPAAGRLARQPASARAVLVRRRAGPAQLPLRPVGTARIAGAGTAHRTRGLGARQSVRRAAPAAPLSAGVRAGPR